MGVFYTIESGSGSPLRFSRFTEGLALYSYLFRDLVEAADGVKDRNGDGPGVTWGAESVCVSEHEKVTGTRLNGDSSVGELDL